jgi:hypothetical protein
MFAWIDYSTPQFFNAKSVVLVLVFSCVAFMVSPLSPLKRTSQDRVALFIPLAILVYWYLFQFQLMSLDPHVHYYLSPTGYFKWMTNSSICYAFGVAFSFRLLRVRTRASRIEGVLFLVLYGFLIVFRDQMRPAMMTT